MGVCDLSSTWEAKFNARWENNSVRFNKRVQAGAAPSLSSDILKAATSQVPKTICQTEVHHGFIFQPCPFPSVH